MPKSVCKMSLSDVQTFQSACFRGFFEKRPQYLQLFDSIPASCSVLLLRKPRAANPRPRNVGVSTKPWTLDKMLPYDGFDNRSQSSSDSKNSSISTSLTACSEDDGKLPSNWRCLSVNRRQRWMRLHIYINNCHNMNERYNPASRFASLALSKRPILKASRCCMEGVWRPLLDVVGWKCQKCDIISNWPIYHIHYSNRGMHICKLKYKEIWAHIKELDSNTYDIYLIMLGFAKYGQKIYYLSTLLGFVQINTYPVYPSPFKDYNSL